MSGSIEPIGTRPYTPPVYQPIHPVSSEPPKQDIEAAQEEVVSLWYVTSLQSMQSMTKAAVVPSSAVSSTEKPAEKSYFGQIGDWLWGKAESLWSMMTGVFQPSIEAEETSQNEQTTTPSPLDKSPKLPAPEMDNQKKLIALVADLNRKLANSLKDIQEFEEEMRKSNSNNIDKLIFWQLVNTTKNQKSLREDSAINLQEDLFRRHTGNKELQKAYYDLMDDIKSRKTTDKVLHWISVGASAGIVGSLAIAGFTGGLGGGVLAVALPISYIGKGIVSTTQAILSYKTDLKLGELTVVNHDIQANSSVISRSRSRVAFENDPTGNRKSR